MKTDTNNYNINVFINCPFDENYLSLLYAIIFTVFDCGYIARCAMEIEDSSEVRIDKIAKIISECGYGIHDISRTGLDEKTDLPRFNMPLELGLFLGAKRFGNNRQKKKNCLLLDRDPYRYQIFLSDLAGQDIRAHNNKEAKVIEIIRNWLSTASFGLILPGGSEILRRYQLFISELPMLCQKLKLTIDEMIFSDYINIISEWLEQNPN